MKAAIFILIAGICALLVWHANRIEKLTSKNKALTERIEWLEYKDDTLTGWELDVFALTMTPDPDKARAIEITGTNPAAPIPIQATLELHPDGRVTWRRPQ